MKTTLGRSHVVNKGQLTYVHADPHSTCFDPIQVSCGVGITFKHRSQHVKLSSQSVVASLGRLRQHGVQCLPWAPSMLSSIHSAGGSGAGPGRLNACRVSAHALISPTSWTEFSTELADSS